MHWHRLSTCDTFSRPEKALGRHEELTECWYLRPEATTSYNITQPGLHLGWIKSSNLGSGIIMDQNPKNPDISRFEFPNSSSSSTILQYLIQPIDVYHPWTSRWTDLRGSDHGSSRKSSISAEDEVLPAAPTQHQLPPAAKKVRRWVNVHMAGKKKGWAERGMSCRLFKEEAKQALFEQFRAMGCRSALWDGNL